MNLAALRTEVLAHGFDPIAFTARIDQYLNDAQFLVARRVDYYVDDATFAINTVAGTDTYLWPTDFARGRSLFDDVRNLELQYVSIRAIDQSNGASGAPLYYAFIGSTVRLYPIPDGVYNLVLRYWKLPNTLVADSDTPTMPADWHRLLWYWAVKECYAAEDDSQTSQYWEQMFNIGLSNFAADQKFPDTDGPNQAAGMWDQNDSLSLGNAWTLYAGW